MYNAGRPDKTLHVIDSGSDVPQEVRGVFLPPEYQARPRARSPRSRSRQQRVSFVPQRVRARTQRTYHIRLALVGTLSLALMLGVGLGTFAALQGPTTVAAPLVSLEAPTGELSIVETGPNEAFTQPSFFLETKEAFIEQELTFIEANLSSMELVYVQAGEEVLRVPIASKGKEGSWWETPAGLYEVSVKKENHFSSFGQVYQPYSMVFQGNFFIHGWPEYEDGTPVPEGYSGGCIRLATEDAAALYELIAVGTPVLVFEESFAGDDFVYEAALPEIEADEYLIADVENNTVLAASDLDSVRPIASITKLMTALVAAEHLNLDDRVRVTQEKYVTTLIPRLSGYGTASMYSLLQLLLVESSNEAAEVIASQLGRERFIELMNDKARALGLSDTTFADPSGLEDGNVATIADLFKLVQYIYHNRSFILELTANQDLPTAYTSGEFGALENFNVMDDMPSFLGGKIGETLAAGQTNLSLHRVQVGEAERVIAVVVLGSDSREQDVQRLLQYVRDRYQAE